MPDVFSKAKAYQLYLVLGQMKDKIREPKYLFTVAKLRKVLQDEADVVAEMLKQPEPIREYNVKREKLCAEYAIKDANGQPTIVANNFIIVPDKRPEFDATLKALAEENKALLDGYQAAVLKIDIELKEPSKSVVSEDTKLPVSCLSPGVTGDQMEVLMPVLLDDSEVAPAAPAPAAAAAAK